MSATRNWLCMFMEDPSHHEMKYCLRCQVSHVKEGEGSITRARQVRKRSEGTPLTSSCSGAPGRAAASMPGPRQQHAAHHLAGDRRDGAHDGGRDLAAQVLVVAQEHVTLQDLHGRHPPVTCMGSDATAHLSLITSSCCTAALPDHAQSLVAQCKCQAHALPHTTTLHSSPGLKSAQQACSAVSRRDMVSSYSACTRSANPPAQRRDPSAAIACPQRQHSQKAVREVAVVLRCPAARMRCLNWKHCIAAVLQWCDSPVITSCKSYQQCCMTVCVRLCMMCLIA